MTNEEIKDSVRKQYTRVVAESSSCCGPGCCGETETATMTTPGMREGYTGVDANIVATADLGLGCGTPTAFAGLAPGMTVLDLGSGAGIDVFIAAKEVGPGGRAIGVDMTDAMLQRAEINRKKLGIANAEFRKGEIEQLPVEDSTIDRVISNCVINLVPDKQKAYAEIFRVLKPGGKVVLSDIVTVGAVPDSLRADMRLWAGCVSGAMDKDAYLGVVRDAGFREVRVLAEKPYTSSESFPFGIVSVTIEATR
ncbi:MAG: arsenite methyltransferase [Bacteroidetes bacterium]|nr:arsenite methyltransferase [Bacteroidota bacterium]